MCSLIERENLSRSDTKRPLSNARVRVSPSQGGSLSRCPDPRGVSARTACCSVQNQLHSSSAAGPQRSSKVRRIPGVAKIAYMHTNRHTRVTGFIWSKSRLNVELRETRTVRIEASKLLQLELPLLSLRQLATHPVGIR